MRQGGAVRHVAEHAGHQEERPARPPSPLVHRHQVVKRRAAAVSAPGALSPEDATAPPLVRPTSAATGADRRRLNSNGNRKFHAESALDLGEQPHRDQRMPAKVEKNCLRRPPGRRPAVPPRSRPAFLDHSLRRNVIGIELGALEFLALSPRCGAAVLSGLRDQRIQRQRRDDHLRPVRRQRAQGRPRPLPRAGMPWLRLAPAVPRRAKAAGPRPRPLNSPLVIGGGGRVAEACGLLQPLIWKPSISTQTVPSGAASVMSKLATGPSAVFRPALRTS